MGIRQERLVDRWLQAATPYIPLLRALILVGIMALAMGARLFSVLRYESVIHEFDPWFNFRVTQHLVEHGWKSFTNWFDTTTWYPLGRHVGPTTFPGMMVTSSILHWIVNRVLAWTVDVREVCVFLAPVFSGLTCLVTYLQGKELQGPGAGIVAAALIAVCPGYISRSVAGSYDYEAIAICQMLIAFYCWTRAIKNWSGAWAGATALAYFYMASTWGGYVYVINLIPMHVIALLLLGRYTRGLYKVYSLFFVLGQLAVMTVKFVGWAPIRASEHLPARAIFLIVQCWAVAYEVYRLVIGACGEVEGRKHFFQLLRLGLLALVVVSATAAIVLAILGINVLGPWAGRLYALIDSEHARKHRPIIASVSEHQPTSWGSYFFDFNILLFLAPVGLYLCFQSVGKGRQHYLSGRVMAMKKTTGRWMATITNQHLFTILYAMTAGYFSAVMVRLMLVLAPIMCILAGMAISRLLRELPQFQSSKPGINPSPDGNDENDEVEVEFDSVTPVEEGNMRKSSEREWLPSLAIIGAIATLLVYYGWHCLWVTSASYSSPSIMLSTVDHRTGQPRIIDDFREGFYWLRRNTKPTARVLSWWDYGYQIAGMARRTTIVDNNTCNNDHIAIVGLAMALPEERSYSVLRRLRADYVLVWAGVMSGFQGDDINKFLWMVRIASGVFPTQLAERDYLTANGEYRVDEPLVPPALRESLMYKMIYYGVAAQLGPMAVDRARNVAIKGVNPRLSILEEAYTTDNHMVRIYKIKEPDVLGRSLFKIKL